MDITYLNNTYRNQILRFFSNQTDEDLRLRFCRYMSYYSIKNYVDNMKFSENDIIVAFVENNNIIAMCELLTSDNNILTGKKTGDVGILVDRSHRNRGLGKKLFGYCVEKALNNNVKVIRSHCMSTNTWMIRICKDYNVNIAQYGSETVAILNDTIF